MFQEPAGIFAFHELDVYHRRELSRNPATGQDEWSPSAGMLFAFLEDMSRWSALGKSYSVPLGGQDKVGTTTGRETVGS